MRASAGKTAARALACLVERTVTWRGSGIRTPLNVPICEYPPARHDPGDWLAST
jgi:hypothetical protein